MIYVDPIDYVRVKYFESLKYTRSHIKCYNTFRCNLINNRSVILSWEIEIEEKQLERNRREIAGKGERGKEKEIDRYCGRKTVATRNNFKNTVKREKQNTQ